MITFLFYFLEKSEKFTTGNYISGLVMRWNWFGAQAFRSQGMCGMHSVISCSCSPDWRAHSALSMGYETWWKAALTTCMRLKRSASPLWQSAVKHWTVPQTSRINCQFHKTSKYCLILPMLTLTDHINKANPWANTLQKWTIAKNYFNLCSVLKQGGRVSSFPLITTPNRQH